MTFNLYSYIVNETALDTAVYEISVKHTDWADLQIEIESFNMLLTPKGAFIITDSGLSPIREEDIWCFIPKLENLEDENGNPYFADIREAEEVFNYLKSRIHEICPNWGKAIPGRRMTRRR